MTVATDWWCDFLRYGCSNAAQEIIQVNIRKNDNRIDYPSFKSLRWL